MDKVVNPNEKETAMADKTGSKCTCTDCPDCKTPTMVCGTCHRCTHCSKHVEGCQGCPESYGAISSLEREMNLTAAINQIESVVEFDRAAWALAARFEVISKQLAKTLLPTFTVGDTVLVKVPLPDAIPLAGKVTKVGKTQDLTLQTAQGILKVPVVRCTKVNYNA